MDQIDLAFETSEAKMTRLAREIVREIRWFFSSFAVCVFTIVVLAGYPHRFPEGYRGYMAVGLAVMTVTAFLVFIYSGTRWWYLDRQITRLNREIA